MERLKRRKAIRLATKEAIERAATNLNSGGIIPGLKSMRKQQKYSNQPHIKHYSQHHAALLSQGRCFRCLVKGHKVNDCRASRKCFNCRRTGHLAKQCKAHSATIVIKPGFKATVRTTHTFKERGQNHFRRTAIGDNMINQFINEEIFKRQPIPQQQLRQGQPMRPPPAVHSQQEGNPWMPNRRRPIVRPEMEVSCVCHRTLVRILPGARKNCEKIVVDDVFLRRGGSTIG